MNICCICLESVPETYPRTSCCKQLIHCDCLQKCTCSYGATTCPLCRIPIQAYPVTRSLYRISKTIRKKTDEFPIDGTMDERVIYISNILKFIYLNMRMVRLISPHLMRVTHKKKEYIHELLPIIDIEKDTYDYVKNIISLFDTPDATDI